MAAHGITFGVISRPQDVPEDQQAVACGAMVETAIPEMPRALADPIRLDFAEQRIARPRRGSASTARRSWARRVLAAESRR